MAATTVKPSDWISTVECGRRVGVSDQMIRDLIKAGRIRHVRFGATDRGRFRVCWPDVAAMFDSSLPARPSPDPAAPPEE